MSEELSPLAMAKSTLRLLGNKSIEELEEVIEERDNEIEMLNEKILRLECHLDDLEQAITKAAHLVR